MSGKSLAKKHATLASMPLVPLIRFAGACVVVLGFVELILQFPDIVSLLWLGEASLLRKTGTFFGALSSPFRLAAVGAMAHVLTQISFGKSKSRTPFDFNGLLGKYLEQESANKVFKRRFLGLTCLLGGPLLSLVGNGLARGAGKSGNVALDIVVFIVGMMIVFLSMFVFLTGLRSIAPRAESMLKRSKRAPILYLRSFQSDAGLFDRGGIGSLIKMLFFGPLANQTVEHSLALAVKDFRPLVAIGQPGERLPPLGAARLYVSSDWQEVVAKLAAASPLVILRIGSTEGFWWEMEHLAKTCDPRKILVYLPPRDRGAIYQQWKERAAGHLPHPLPSQPWQASFLAFRSDWQPYLLGKRGPSAGAWWRGFLAGRAPEIREALNVHLRELGANPTRLPFLGREVFFLFLIVLAFFAFVLIPLFALIEPLRAPMTQF